MARLGHSKFVFALALLSATIAGCTAPEVPAAAVPPTSAPATVVQPTAAVVTEEAAEAVTLVATQAIDPSPAAAPDAETPAPSTAAYEPPFPDRIDLFVAPKRQGGASTEAGVEGGDVELLGFVRVDRPRAVLAINGQIAPMAAGEMQFGVEVISVHPPSVVLQRGRQRWQATLE